MRKFLAHYFYYTKRERAGILMFLILVALPNLISVFLPIFKKKIPPATFLDIESATLHFQTPIQSAESDEPINEPIKVFELFPFNPNDASYADLLRLGISARVTSTLIHYREKGGHFYKKEDLKKVYGLSPDNYARLESYIRLEKESENNKFSTSNYSQAINELGSTNKIELVNFNPNTASELTLLNLGLEKNIVKNLLKYREKGGIFKKKEDIKKIYAFTELDFLRLEPYLQITDNQTGLKNETTATPPDDKYFNKKNTMAMTDLNTATEADLLRLYGIGHTFALRIAEYRMRLGGFVTISQLKEVYGIPDSIIHIATPYLNISPIFRKIHINKANLDDFKHPYLTNKQVDVLLRYRTNHGNFHNFDDLKKIGVFNDEQLEKLKPYIDFE